MWVSLAGDQVKGATQRETETFYAYNGAVGLGLSAVIASALMVASF